MKLVPRPSDPVTAVYLVKRKPGMSFEAFKRYQQETHVPLALALPGLKSYRLTFFPPQGDADQAIDAAVEVTFESVEASQAAMASEAGQAAAADLPNVLDMANLTIVMSGSGETFEGAPA